MITAEKFYSYEFVRQSGVVNMLLIHSVVKTVEMLELEPITEKEVIEIINNYSKFSKLYM